MLSEQRRLQLDGVVKQMIDNNEPDGNIQFVVDDFKQKYQSENEQPVQQNIEQKKNLAEKIGGFLGIDKFGKALGQAAFQFTPEYNQLKQMLGEGKITPEEFESISTGGITSKQVLGSSAQTGLNVAALGGVGTVGSLGARILKTTGLGAGFGASEEFGKGGGAQNIAKSAALSGGIGAVLPFAGAGLRALGRQISQLPARFVNSALGRSKAEILQDIAKDKVDDFAKFVIQKKPIASANKLLNEGQGGIETLGNKINAALETAVRKTGQSKTIGLNNFFDQVAKTPEAEGALLKRADIKAIIERLAPQTKQLLSKQSLTLPEANKLRQLADKTLGDRAFLGAQLTSDKIILKKFADNLRETVKQKAPEETRALFAELSNEIRFRDGLLEKIAKRGGNQVLSFGDFIGGGLGGIFGGGIGGAVLGVGARRLIEAVPTKLLLARTVNALTKTAPVLDSLTPIQQTAILNIFAEIFSDIQEKEQ